MGGFASGTAAGIRTRRYHSLLLAATTPPTGRLVLVNGLDAWVESAGRTFQLSSQCYAPGVVGGEGGQLIEAFGWEPWPHWIFKLEDGTRIEQELFVSKGQRDGCYHQGTVWPWLIGPFVEAWVRVRGGTDDEKREARGKFLAPILAHLEEAGLGHISEIADAQPPHTPRGCPFQAWSVGEALRLDRVVLCETPVIDTKRKSVSKRSQEPIAA